jgi:hypothetical protein
MNSIKFDWEKELWDSSRNTIDRVAAIVGSSPALFKEMFELAIKENDKTSRRASRVIFACSEKSPELVKPYLKKIIEMLEPRHNESLRRDFFRIFAEVTLPDDEEALGRLINYCFDCLNSITKQVSLKVYCLEILYKITLKEPELKKELALTIESIMPYSSMAFVSRGRRALKKMNIKTESFDED